MDTKQLKKGEEWVVMKKKIEDILHEGIHSFPNGDPYFDDSVVEELQDHILSILKELEVDRKTRANPMDYPKDSPAELNALANSGFNLAVTELNSKIEEIRGRYEN